MTQPTDIVLAKLGSVLPNCCREDAWHVEQAQDHIREQDAEIERLRCSAAASLDYDLVLAKYRVAFVALTKIGLLEGEAAQIASDAMQKAIDLGDSDTREEGGHHVV